MLKSTVGIALIVVTCSFAGSVFGELSTVDTIAVHSGRILGAAKSCGVDGQRLQATAELVFLSINARAASRSQQDQATRIFEIAMEEGQRQVRSGEIKCATVKEAYETIERQFKQQK